MAERVPFRGGLTCSCVVASLPWVEEEMLQRGIIKESIDIYQLGYRGDVSASAGTHDRGGCIDVGQYSREAIDVWRLWGWTMQNRSPYFKADHAHGWPYRCNHLSAAAQDQERDWDRKDAGLQGNVEVEGRWPISPWYIALNNRKPIFQKEGFPVMAADSVPINIANFTEVQPLSGSGRVWINSERHTTVVGGSSKGIDVQAAVQVDGLKAGEWARFWWIREWKKDNQPDQNKGSRPSVTFIGAEDDNGNPIMQADQVAYKRSLPKADSGWTACLRLAYSTNSKTAEITRREFDGWKLT